LGRRRTHLWRQTTYIFENWADNKVDVYSIQKTSGNYNAILESSYNANGLITGAETSANEKVIYLTGYSSSAAPFLYTIHSIPNNIRCVFWSNLRKISNIVPLGNQIEARF
jgi:hypothetical protein